MKYPNQIYVTKRFDRKTGVKTTLALDDQLSLSTSESPLLYHDSMSRIDLIGITKTSGNTEVIYSNIKADEIPYFTACIKQSMQILSIHRLTKQHEMEPFKVFPSLDFPDFSQEKTEGHFRYRRKDIGNGHRVIHDFVITCDPKEKLPYELKLLNAKAKLKKDQYGVPVIDLSTMAEEQLFTMRLSESEIIRMAESVRETEKMFKFHHYVKQKEKSKNAMESIGHGKCSVQGEPPIQY